MSLYITVSACSQATLLSSLGVGMGVAQKSTASTVYGAVDVGVSATTDKSIREHVLGTATTESEGSHWVNENPNIQWVTPK